MYAGCVLSGSNPAVTHTYGTCSCSRAEGGRRALHPFRAQAEVGNLESGIAICDGYCDIGNRRTEVPFPACGWAVMHARRGGNTGVFRVCGLRLTAGLAAMLPGPAA